jgi:hypothetical protein
MLYRHGVETTEGTKTHNPAFGMISISRGTTSGKMPLFGSSLKHSAFIKVTINRAVLYRDLYRDSYFPEEILINLYMSPSQFADAITSFNTGGVPCTLEWFNGEHIPEPPFENRRVQFDEEFTKKMEDTISDNNKFIVKIHEILAKPNIGKKDREDIVQQLSMLRMQIASNIPFIKTSFTEQMDQTVIEAKNEISHTIEEKLKTLGLEKFKDQFQLEFKPEDSA